MSNRNIKTSRNGFVVANGYEEEGNNDENDVRICRSGGALENLGKEIKNWVSAAGGLYPERFGYRNPKPCKPQPSTPAA